MPNSSKMSDRRHHHNNSNKNDKKTRTSSSSRGNKSVGDSFVKTEASTPTSTSTTSQLQGKENASSRNRIELLVQEIGLEAVWGVVTIIQELGFDSVFRIVREQQQHRDEKTDNNAIPHSVSSSSSTATAAAAAAAPPTNSTHPSPAPETPVAFVESDFIKQESEEKEKEGGGEAVARAESRGAAFASGTKSTTATATAPYPEQQPLAQNNDENNSHNVVIKLEEINNKDTQPPIKSSNSGRKRKQPPSAKDGVDPSNPNDNPKARKKKARKNRQGGGHMDYETTASQKPMAINNHASQLPRRRNNHRAEEDKKEEDCAIDNNNKNGTVKDNCCQFCNDPEWESKIHYKCGTILKKYFPKSNNNPNPGWYKGTIHMHHLSSSNSGIDSDSDSDSEYEEEADSISEGESDPQQIIYNEILYDDGDTENITQDDLKHQMTDGGRVKILHPTKMATASNSERHNRVDVVPPATSFDNKFGRLWLETYERLKQFKAKNGHCRVPQHGKDPSLANWVMNQRLRCKKGKLAEDRFKKLEKIGFEWAIVTPDQAWQEKYDRLIIFKDENGTCRVPQNYGPDPSLGTWVNNQRRHYKKGTLAPDREQKLEEIDFEWVLVARTPDQFWEENYERLKQFKAKNGHCRVPQKYDPDPALGIWVKNQRKVRKKSNMAPDREEKLEEIDFEWDPVAKTADGYWDIWNENYDRLRIFKTKKGHCRVPFRYSPDPSLGFWVGKQRQHHKKGTLDPYCAKKLEEIGFEWDLRNC